MNPGVAMKLDASIRSAPAGTRTESKVPISRIAVPSMSSRPGEYFSVGVQTVPASMTIGLILLTPGSKVAEDTAKIALGIRELFLRFRAIAACRAHDHRDSQVRSRRVDQFLGFIRLDAEDFLKHLFPPGPQLLIGHADIDHPVAVCHSEADHQGGAEHVQHKLLCCSGFHARRSCDD